MKIAIIGAGNMGAAITRGLMRGVHNQEWEVAVANPHENKLRVLQTEWPQLHIYTNNWEAALDAQVIILAVEPDRVADAYDQVAPQPGQLVVSIAARFGLDRLEELMGSDVPLFRAMPNTPIAVGEGMTLIASRHASPEDERLVLSVFREAGGAMLLPESQLEAGMVLASCGVAYTMKYVQAMVQGGIELGLTPQVAMRLTAQALIGSGRLLLDDETHPSIELERVTTPGGVTIKGVNELDHAGFASAVLRAVKAAK